MKRQMELAEGQQDRFESRAKEMKRDATKTLKKGKIGLKK